MSYVQLLHSHLEAFQERLGSLNKVLQLSRLLNDEEGKRDLGVVKTMLHDLSTINKEMRTRISESRGKLEELQFEHLKVEALRKELNLMMIAKLSTVKLRGLENFSLNLKSQGVNNSVEKANKLPTSQSKSGNEEKENRLPPKKVKVRNIEQLGENELKEVPKYLKGHLSIDQLNLGVSEINVILAKKYEYLDVPKGSLSVGDRKIRGDYRKEIVDMQSSGYTTFFNDDDLMKFGRMLKTKKQTCKNCMLVLRHLGKMKEVRKGKSTKYCLVIK